MHMTKFPLHRDLAGVDLDDWPVNCKPVTNLAVMEFVDLPQRCRCMAWRSKAAYRCLTAGLTSRFEAMGLSVVMFPRSGQRWFRSIPMVGAAGWLGRGGQRQGLLGGSIAARAEC